MAGAFIQGESESFRAAASAVKRLVGNSQYISDEDRSSAMSFLSGTDANEYGPQSGEIVGILKQILEGMEKDEAELSSTEAEAVKSYEGLMAAKTKEVTAIGSSIEQKTTSIGELGVSIAQMKE